MKRLLALATLAVSLVFMQAAPASAQTVNAKTVVTCGTPGNTPVIGNSYPITQDTTGVLCTSSSGGGGGSASYTAAASPFAVTAGVNKPAGVSTTNSAQWMIPVKPGTTTEIDLSGVSTIAGADGSSVASNANPVPVSVQSSALPTGAATAAKQPALGTAGTPSSDVITVQGSTSGTPLPATLAAATTGGCTPYGLTSAASTNSTNIKASAGTLCSVSAVNTTATLYYLRLYNLSSAPTCSSATGFVLTIPVPASATGAGVVVTTGSYGWAFGTGIGFCLTAGGSSTDNTAAATGVYLAASYK